MRAGLRQAEWLCLIYFGYVVVLSGILHRPNLKHQPLWIFLAAAFLLFAIAQAETWFPAAISLFRDFLPVGLTLIAFEEMNYFATSSSGHFEQAWIRWDVVLLQNWHVRAVIESLGPLIPAYLELCYLLVYGLGIYCVIVLYAKHKREDVDRFYLILLTGTLTAYALFPFFPSQPPRLLFPGLEDPAFMNSVRRLNLWILQKTTIHTAVFPSAHVSSAFAGVWAMFVLFPREKRIGWGLLCYAVSVSIATIYGRYHYAADVLAGFAVSLMAAAVALSMRLRRHGRTLPES